MAQPTSSVDLVNIALLQLYQGNITSLQDANDPVATAGLRLYDMRRRSLLRNFLWNFARTRNVASLVSNQAPPFDYQAYYQLPLDCLALQWVGFDWNRYASFDYDIQGRFILLNPDDPAWMTAPPNGATQQPSVNIEYTRDETDVTLFDPLFVDTFTLNLAVDMCMPVTGDRELLADLRSRLKEVLAEAVAANHRERPIRVTQVDYIAQARQLTDDFGSYDLRVDPAVWPTT